MGLFLPESKENGMFGGSFLKKKKEFTSQFTFPKENQLIERFGKDFHPTESTALWAFCPVEGYCALTKNQAPGMQGQAGQTHKAFWAGLFS